MAELLIVIVAILQLTGFGSGDWARSLVSKVSRAQVAWVAYHQQATPVGQLDNLSLTATSAMAIDAASGQVLYAKNPDHPQAIASLTKVFTILTVLNRHSLEETVTVPTLPAYANGAVALGLTPGEQFKLRDIVKAALIPSANDAADALAIWDAGRVPTFASQANQLMKDWGIADVQLSSASGLDDAGNSATARALGLAGRLLLTNPQVKEITSTQQAQVSDLAGRSFGLSSTNQLLKNPSFSGIKTGYTVTAGQCLLAKVNIGGHEVMTVILGSQDRFGETQALANAIRESYQWH